jgi:hypothetical protein
MRRSILTATAALALTACGGGNTESSVQAPGAEETAKTKVLETGAAVLQDRPPIDGSMPTWMAFISTTVR